MESDRDRHRLGAQVLDRRSHFERAVRQPVRELDRVREGPLLHPRRLLVEIEPAGDPR